MKRHYFRRRFDLHRYKLGTFINFHKMDSYRFTTVLLFKYGDFSNSTKHEID